MSQSAAALIQPDKTLSLVQQMEWYSLDNALPSGPQPVIEKPTFWRVVGTIQFGARTLILITDCPDAEIHLRILKKKKLCM